MLPSVHLCTVGFKKTKHMGLDFPPPVLRVWLQGFVLCLFLGAWWCLGAKPGDVQLLFLAQGKPIWCWGSNQGGLQMSALTPVLSLQPSAISFSLGKTDIWSPDIFYFIVLID